MNCVDSLFIRFESTESGKNCESGEFGKPADSGESSEPGNFGESGESGHARPQTDRNVNVEHYYSNPQ